MRQRPTPSPPGCVFAIFLLFGLAFEGLVVWFILVPEFRAHFVYEPNVCMVHGKRLSESIGDEGPTYRPEILIEYEVAGQKHRTWTYDASGIYSSGAAGKQEILARFQVGQQYPCWYDPANHDKAVLVRGFNWLAVMFGLLPLVFIAVGAGGLAYKRKKKREPLPPPDPREEAGTAEARRLLARRSRGPALGCGVLFGITVALFFGLSALGAPTWVIHGSIFTTFVVFVLLTVRSFRGFSAELARVMPSPEREATTAATATLLPSLADDWPNVPRLNPDVEPGRILPVRLFSSTTPGCALGGWLFLALFWNGIIAYPVLGNLKALRAGQNVAWWPTLFLVPFVLAGLFLVFQVVRSCARLLIALTLGRVRVEVSVHPLRAGCRYEVLVGQSGLFPLTRPCLELVCEESASYSQGTSTVTATKVVFRRTVFDPESPNLDGGLDGWHSRLEVRAGAMHSFQSGHNNILWKLVLSGRAAGLLPYASEYPVIVLPEPEEGEKP